MEEPWEDSWLSEPHMDIYLKMILEQRFMNFSLIQAQKELKHFLAWLFKNFFYVSWDLILTKGFWKTVWTQLILESKYMPMEEYFREYYLITETVEQCQLCPGEGKPGAGTVRPRPRAPSALRAAARQFPRAGGATRAAVSVAERGAAGAAGPDGARPAPRSAWWSEPRERPTERGGARAAAGGDGGRTEPHPAETCAGAERGGVIARVPGRDVGAAPSSGSEAATRGGDTRRTERRGPARPAQPRTQPREERAGTSSPDNSNTGATERESKDAARQKTAATRKKEKIIVTKILGIVKWYNVKQNYGFITKCDNQQDIFVHRTAIKKNNPEKCIPSLGDGEVVEFKIIRGRKGLQASQVTGPDGISVKGSIYAKNRSHVRQYLHCKPPLQSPFPNPTFPFYPMSCYPQCIPNPFFHPWFPSQNHAFANCFPKNPFPMPSGG
uniref:Uncharacterized protein n=1 Tax=Corvus moneduloides TaxID=1196302 RepID=A0A8U7MGL6_CORMO